MTELFGSLNEDRCPACGEVIDYCQGHGPIGDPAGAEVLERHDDDDHTYCRIEAGCTPVVGTIGGKVTADEHRLIQEYGFLARVYDGNVLYDRALTWETAESMALNEGLRVEVVYSASSHWTVERVQSLCDTALAQHRDCWGVGS